VPTATGAAPDRPGTARTRPALRPKSRRLTRALLALTALGVLGTEGYCALPLSDRPRDLTDQQPVSAAVTAAADTGRGRGVVRAVRLRPGDAPAADGRAPGQATYAIKQLDAGRTMANASAQETVRLSAARIPGDGRPADTRTTPVDARTATLGAESAEQAALCPVVRAELVIAVPVLGLLVLGALWCSRRALLPIREMNRTARRIAEASDEPSERLPSVPRPPRELQCTADTLNYLLRRIEEGAVRRKQAELRLHELVGAASHELRTPLTTITGYTQLARIGALDDPRRLNHAMEQVQREIHRMNRLVEDLLLLARLSQGGMLEQRPVDLAEVCADAVARAQAPGARHALRCVTQSPTHPVEGDRHRLEQVIGHLVSNVLAHTPENTSAEVRLRLDGDRQVIDVVDDGPGVPEAAREHVFEPFFRAENTPSAPDDDPCRGRGLGLSVAAAVVKAHGGTIALRPSERGAWFHVTLPALDERARAETASVARAALS
jgi:signal transduction histidine kinase